MIEIIINVFPGNERFVCYFDENKSFKDLKNDLMERHMIKKDKYHIEINDNIMNDDLIIKDSGVINNSYIYIIRNDSIKVNMEIMYLYDETEIIKLYMLKSDFKIIKANEYKEVTVCNNIFF